MIYWDTSCVLKLYAREDDSEEWAGRVAETGSPLTSSSLLSAELLFALEQKEFRGELKAGGAEALGEHFRKAVEKGRFQLYPIGADVLAESARMAATCYHGDHPLPLRTLDGLHLATARLVRCDAIATTDRRMRRAADALGFSQVE